MEKNSENIYGLRINERTIKMQGLDSNTSGELLIVNIDTFENVGKILPPAMDVVYKEGYKG